MLDQIVRALGGVKSGEGWKCKCPAPDDNHPSLSVTPSERGLLVHCHAGCKQSAVIGALRSRGLWPADAATTTPRKAAGTPRAYATLDEAVNATADCLKGTRAGTWHYHHADGTDAMVVVRFNLPGGAKEIRPFHRNGKGWVCKGPPGKRPLYKLADITLGTGTTYIVEGEKCCDAAMGIGLNATTSAGGSKAAGKTDWTPLAGRAVVIQPDNDNPGRKHTATVAGILRNLDPPATVRVVELPDLPDGGDIVDYIGDRDSIESDDLRARIDGMPDTTTATPMPDPPPVAWVSIDVVMRDSTYTTGLPCVTSGLASLDRLIGGGFRCGSVTIIGGRTGASKSMLCANIARRAALSDVTSLFLSLEDSLCVAVWRMHGATANTPTSELLDGFGGRDGPAIEALRTAYPVLNDLPLRLSDVRPVGDIVRLIHRHADEGGELVIIDQLSKISTPDLPIASTYERVSSISEALRLTARERRLPIVVACQVNREGQKRNAELELHDLRDSGMLEQDAACVLLLNQATAPPATTLQPKPHARILPVKLAKNRFGPFGQTVRLLWHPRVGRIDDLTMEGEHR